MMHGQKNIKLSELLLHECL